MVDTVAIGQKAELTFKHNLKQGRHGWLRLTPAYSVKVVQEILEKHSDIRHVLDPFSGTGTTGLVSAEKGLVCELLDINPFLVWLANAKAAMYLQEDIQSASQSAKKAVQEVLELSSADSFWIPPLHNIERWWTEERLGLLAKLRYCLQQMNLTQDVRNILDIAFCRFVIETSNAAFNHQSMSFRKQENLLFDADITMDRFINIVQTMLTPAASHFVGSARAFHADARHVPPPSRNYDAVITSPPYPNRMSYIRELRPYMYWLGYLTEAREAGELDWQAIGGTWGIATSRLQTWQPNGVSIPYETFNEVIESISEKSPLLANYVHKYFVDMVYHVSSLTSTLAPNARLFYIVGNSKFYETVVPVQEILASIFRDKGFSDIKVDVLRKRNSKKELLEFIVSARNG
jgi:hypothetical protein